jgi:hypothetical protein
MATPEDCPLIGDEESIMQTTLVSAAREILSDSDLMASFWRGGYVELSSHVRRGASDFIFSKFIAMIGGALLAAGVYLIARFGSK